MVPRSSILYLVDVITCIRHQTAPLLPVLDFYVTTMGNWCRTEGKTAAGNWSFRDPHLIPMGSDFLEVLTRSCCKADITLLLLL